MTTAKELAKKSEDLRAVIDQIPARAEQERRCFSGC